MGRYVCVGIQNKVSVPKSHLDEFKDEYSHEELLAFFEQTHQMTDVFERSETEDAYVYQIKDEIVEKELLPFLKDFYPIRYPEKKSYEEALKAVEACKNIDELKKLMEESYSDYDNAFQIIEDGRSCYLNSDSFDRRSFSYSFQNVSLSIDGKILMEYYASFLGFIRRTLNELFRKYKLADSIRVWIDG